MTTRTRRRTTVHDLASLRLHPDGSRVQNTQGSSSGSAGVSSQTHLRAAKYVAQDAHGNWIARDAGGSGAVKQKYSKQDKGKGKASDLDDLYGGDDLVEEEGKELEGRKDSRAVKRRKFQHDLSFLDELELPSSSLENLPSSIQDPSQSNQNLSLPIPSSDLLKCIHYFASEYYASHGLLSNVAREAKREARIARKKKKDAEEAEKRNDKPDDQPNPNQEPGNDAPAQTEEQTGVADKPKRRGGRKAGKKWEEARIRRDMYKAFDGSALMALGMLIQEHVAELMDVSPPEGWEEQMEAETAQEAAGRQARGGRRRRRKSRKRLGLDVTMEGDQSNEDDSEDSDDNSSSGESSSSSEASESSSSESNDSSTVSSSD